MRNQVPTNGRSPSNRQVSGTNVSVQLTGWWRLRIAGSWLQQHCRSFMKWWITIVGKEAAFETLIPNTIRFGSCYATLVNLDPCFLLRFPAHKSLCIWIPSFLSLQLSMSWVSYFSENPCGQQGGCQRTLRSDCARAISWTFHDILLEMTRSWGLFAVTFHDDWKIILGITWKSSWSL